MKFNRLILLGNRIVMAPIVRIIYLTLIASLILMLAGCVTTERGGIGEKANDEVALRSSLQLARSYIQQRNWRSAKRHLKLAIDIDDSSPDVYEGLALVFQNTGEPKLAENNYKKAIRLGPDISRIRNNYAVFLYQFNRYEEAASQLERITKDTFYENRASAFINLGRCYVQLKQYEKAREIFNRAYLLGARTPALMLNIAEVQYQLEDYPSAQRYYDAYRKQVKVPSARGLLMGAQLADKLENSNAFSSHSMALKNLYPGSTEYEAYKQLFNKVDK